MTDKYLTNLDFHQTFKPERTCLTSIFQALPECSGKTPREISIITGVPTGKSSGKVVPTIKYLEMMGLISEQKKERKLDYTSLGRKVLYEDLVFMEDLTLMLLHCFLLRPVNGAALWNCIFFRILPGHHGLISMNDLELELRIIFGKYPLMAPFKGSYTGLFENLNLLKIENDGYRMSTHLYRPEFIYLYALVLYEYWNEWLLSFPEKKRTELTVSDVEISSSHIEEIGFRRPFGWSETDEFRVLEEMDSKGLVSLNRQMTPFSLRKIITREELIEMLYSELC